MPFEKSMMQKSQLETVGLLTTTIVHDMNNFLYSDDRKSATVD